MRFLEEAKKHLLKGAEFCEKINFAGIDALAHMYLGETYFESGEYQQSKNHYSKAIWHLENCKLLPSNIKWNTISLARAKVMNNAKDINLNEIFKYHENNKYKSYEGRILNCIGEILLNIDEYHKSESEDWIKRAIAANNKNGTRWYLAKDYALYAYFFIQKDDLPKARENLTKAIDIFKECGADGWVKKYEKELAALS